ncbi:uncharacterized protein EI90DRAFT_3076397 [Cantharellus anzutake]|uniref:uncharacterized protein n=1 Tax=Cantharellus anzutake TaxID=1750568 RepID=UPI001905849B|nr:uncharacterized protein EI90DRAFT_3076397 [Cantharellus anzutake]KAF8324224.1 hypothetical protein EI90DRAFT_3076397 [Cantharellus anzutake]
MPSITGLKIMWPTQVLQGTNRSVRWSDGIPPYELDVSSLQPTKRLYTYIGNNLVLYWVIDVPPGTLIQYNVTDSGGSHVGSTAITVQSNPVLSAGSLLSIASTLSLVSVSSVSVISASSASPQTSSNSDPASTLSLFRTSNPSSPTQTLPLSKTLSPSSPTRAPSGGGNITGTIAGGAVGGAAGLLLIGLVAFFLLRRRKSDSRERRSAFEAPNTGYPGAHATQNILVPQAVPSLYPSDAPEPPGASIFQRTVTGSMMTANEGEEYQRHIAVDRGGYVRVNNARGYPSKPGLG